MDLTPITPKQSSHPLRNHVACDIFILAMMQTHKVIIVGDARVGKTSLVNRLFEERRDWREEYVATLGVDVKPFVVYGNPPCHLNVWDVAGDPRYWGLREEGEGYYNNASIAIIVYDNDTMTLC